MPRRPFEQMLSHRADQAGILLAGTNVPLTFQRTLMPRPTIDQALVTGLSIFSNHAVVSLLQESIQALALVGPRLVGQPRPSDRAWSKATIALDLTAIGAGIAVQRRYRYRYREPLPRAATRTAGYWLSVTGTAGAVIGTLQELFVFGRHEHRATVPVVVPAAAALAVAGEVRRRRSAHLDDDLPPDEAKVAPGKALLLGATVAGAVSAMGLGERVLADRVAHLLARALPASPEVLRPVGHVVALGLLGTATRLLVEQAFGDIEKRETAVEAAYDIPPPNPLVSGSLDSVVDYDSLSKQGRRYAWTVTSTEKIREIMQEPDVAAPIRVYVGLESARTEDERVALVLDELERTRAFDRTWLLLASPTGTGYVNYAAVGALELLARGDCATVAMQYAARPSVLSLGRVQEGRRQARLLITALSRRLADLPADRRPKLVLFGESLGAWTSQDPFVDQGSRGLVDAGIDHALWIGTPHFSKWKEQVLYDDRPDVEPGIVQVCPDIATWNALDPAARARARYVMITHHDDGVALFGPELAIQAPPWLCPPDGRPSGVPRAMRWMPSTTFFQVLVDMKNSANVVPGTFAAKGHDYRADLLPFFHAVLGLDATPEQLDRVNTWLQEDELERSTWIKQHGGTGRSMAAAIVDYAVRRARARGEDPNELLASLVAGVAEEEFNAAGGANLPTAGEAKR
jgi:uncharacterized membrane protein